MSPPEDLDGEVAETVPDTDPEQILLLDDADRGGEPDVDTTTGTWYSRRQVLAASFAGLVLGVGLGMAYATKTLVDSQRRSVRPTAVDLGFVNDMLDHHNQAVEMSLITLGRPGIGGSTRQFATEVIIFQRYEIGLLEGRLNSWGVDQGEDDRVAMGWMGMGTPVKSMPGMATDEDLERLKTASGIDADRQFLTLMRAHHQGGVHMAEYARDHATDDQVISLAARMAYNQKLEVSEYTRTLNGLPKT